MGGLEAAAAPWSGRLTMVCRLTAYPRNGHGIYTGGSDNYSDLRSPLTLSLSFISRVPFLCPALALLPSSVATVTLSPLLPFSSLLRSNRRAPSHCRLPSPNAPGPFSPRDSGRERPSAQPAATVAAACALLPSKLPSPRCFPPIAARRTESLHARAPRLVALRRQGVERACRAHPPAPFRPRTVNLKPFNLRRRQGIAPRTRTTASCTAQSASPSAPAPPCSAPPSGEIDDGLNRNLAFRKS